MSWVDSSASTAFAGRRASRASRTPQHAGRVYQSAAPHAEKLSRIERPAHMVHQWLARMLGSQKQSAGEAASAAAARERRARLVSVPGALRGATKALAKQERAQRLAKAAEAERASAVERRVRLEHARQPDVGELVSVEKEWLYEALQGRVVPEVVAARVAALASHSHAPDYVLKALGEVANERQHTMMPERFEHAAPMTRTVSTSVLVFAIPLKRAAGEPVPEHTAAPKADEAAAAAAGSAVTAPAAAAASPQKHKPKKLLPSQKKHAKQDKELKRMHGDTSAVDALVEPELSPAQRSVLCDAGNPTEVAKLLVRLASLIGVDLMADTPADGSAVAAPGASAGTEAEAEAEAEAVCASLDDRTSGDAVATSLVPLNRQQRAQRGLKLPRRTYNRCFRFLKLMAKRLDRMRARYDLAMATHVAKSGLAVSIPRAVACADVPTLSFLAYYVSRCNRRSEFTNTSQDRPFDTVSNALLRWCSASAKTTDWVAVAHAFVNTEVLSHMSAQAKGELLGRWYDRLRRLSKTLERIWESMGSAVDRQSMCVRRGMNSSDWNAAAGAWNTCRRHWMALLTSLGMDAMLDVMCPGKVMRLMAADVLAWQRASGHDVHPDTKVWAQLPLPWEVLDGRAECTRSTVADACASVDVDPVKNGWTDRAHDAQPVPFRATPELFVGVTISSPELAALLRKDRARRARE